MWKPLTVGCHIAMFGAKWSATSGDQTYLICHVTSQDHVIEKWVGPPHGKLPGKCCGHKHSGSRDMMLLICHEIPQD